MTKTNMADYTGSVHKVVEKKHNLTGSIVTVRYFVTYHQTYTAKVNRSGKK
jgi:hypothetical protein